MARMAIALDAGIIVPSGQIACTVENISRSGCRLYIDNPPAVGATRLVRIERIEALGSIIWVRGQQVGFKFDACLKPQEVERVRWIVDHAHEHRNKTLAQATAIWR